MQLENAVVSLSRKPGKPLEVVLGKRETVEERPPSVAPPSWVTESTISGSANASFSASYAAEGLSVEAALRAQVADLQAQLTYMKGALGASVAGRLALAQALEEMSTQVVTLTEQRAEQDERLKHLTQKK